MRRNMNQYLTKTVAEEGEVKTIRDVSLSTDRTKNTIKNPYINNVSIESKKSLLSYRNIKLKELSPNRSIFQTSFMQQL